MATADEPVSGLYGCVELDGGTSIADVTNWQYTATEEDQNYSSCDTQGYRRRVDGIKDITGSFEVVYNSDASFKTAIEVGKLILLNLFHRVAATGQAGTYDFIPAKVLGWSGSVPIETGGVQRFTINWALAPTDTDPLPLFDETAAAL